ncbi:MAG: DNA methyltransferase [Candidatus Aminicenantes bacterium]|nr:DNA methyltransferase [Candidatus Aminicenantes bacterium]
MFERDIKNYNEMYCSPAPAPEYWHRSCAHSECTLHQLSPYIGKLKSSIARDLIQAYSKPGELVTDPFAGSGTVPLEAALLGRRVFAADISPYARILTTAKLNAPPCLEEAIDKAEKILALATTSQPAPDFEKIPAWVGRFFHPRTLDEAVKFASVAREAGNEFFMACFLGILHHERPGFLSFPASHLVPYLRDKKYPPQEFPGMYEYRPLRPRLLAKISRIYKRNPGFPGNLDWSFRQSKIEDLEFPEVFDCLITSPPYMNALDYGRDNRLRLWFINPGELEKTDNPVTKAQDAFYQAIAILAEKINRGLKNGGFCVLIVGERLESRRNADLSRNICRIITEKTPTLKLIAIIKDNIPDIRRTRRNCRATKTEHILVYQRSQNEKISAE